MENWQFLTFSLQSMTSSVQHIMEQLSTLRLKFIWWKKVSSQRIREWCETWMKFLMWLKKRNWDFRRIWGGITWTPRVTFISWQKAVIWKTKFRKISSTANSLKTTKARRTNHKSLHKCRILSKYNESTAKIPCSNLVKYRYSSLERIWEI
jgi:hypothetical protein